MSPTRFGIFELDTTSGELRKRGVKVRLPEQVYRVLNTLLEHPGEVVSRERLKESVWPDRTFVDFESALNKCISQLRTILGDSGHNPRFVETLSKRGYRFIAPIQPTRRDDSSRSIVVLPFDSPFDHGAQSYLAAGVTDMLTTALGEVRLLRVISRTSANTFVTSSKPLSALGRELGVDLAVEGSVIRLEPAICVTVRLVNIHSELVVWQGQDRCRTGPFDGAVQSGGSGDHHRARSAARSRPGGQAARRRRRARSPACLLQRAGPCGIEGPSGTSMAASRSSSEPWPSIHRSPLRTPGWPTPTSCWAFGGSSQRTRHSEWPVGPQTARWN